MNLFIAVHRVLYIELFQLFYILNQNLIFHLFLRIYIIINLNFTFCARKLNIKNIETVKWFNSDDNFHVLFTFVFVWQYLIVFLFYFDFLKNAVNFLIESHYSITTCLRYFAFLKFTFPRIFSFRIYLKFKQILLLRIDLWVEWIVTFWRENVLNWRHLINLCFFYICICNLIFKILDSYIFWIRKMFFMGLNNLAVASLIIILCIIYINRS